MAGIPGGPWREHGCGQTIAFEALCLTCQGPDPLLDHDFGNASDTVGGVPEAFPTTMMCAPRPNPGCSVENEFMIILGEPGRGPRFQLKP